MNMTRLIQVLSRLLSRLSHSALQRVGASLGWLAAHLVPVRRREVRAALRRAFPEKTEAERRAIARGMYRHLAITAVECLAYTAPGARDFADVATSEGREHLESVLAQGRGALLLMGHIGNWECMGRTLSVMGYTPSVVVRGFRNKGFETYWREARLRLGVRAVNRENSYRPCVRMLRQNEIVAMVLDQNARAGRGVFVDFFGQPASTTPGLAQLAARTQTPVIPMSMHRGPDGRHHMRLGAPLPPLPDHGADAVRDATRQYTRVLEDLIRAHPEQWTWGHRRWRTRPGNGSANGEAES